MPRTVTAIRAPGNSEIRNLILEGGKVLAALIGKDFPVADDVWPEINQFNRMICGFNIEDTWVTMITPDDREVNDVAFGILLFLWLLLMPYFRLYCRP